MRASFYIFYTFFSFSVFFYYYHRASSAEESIFSEDLILSPIFLYFSEKKSRPEQRMKLTSA